jgi:hypothetical protein
VAVDEIGSGPRPSAPRRRGALLAAGVVLAGAAVGAVLVAQPSGPAHVPAPAPSAHAASPVARRVDLGTAFLAVVPGCTSTDHTTTLRLALDVTNLGDRPIRFVDAVPLGPAQPGLALAGVQAGAGPCGLRPAPTASVAPAHDVVVALTYRLTGGCPRPARPAVTVAFAIGSRLARADSSTLVDLRTVSFAACPPG